MDLPLLRQEQRRRSGRGDGTELQRNHHTAVVWLRPAGGPGPQQGRGRRNYIYLFCLTSSAVEAARTTGSVMFNSPWNQWYVRGNPIIDITAKSGSSRPATPSGYVRVEGYDATNRTTVDPDINRGAGGKYVYLYYKRSPALVSNSP